MTCRGHLPDASYRVLHWPRTRHYPTPGAEAARAGPQVGRLLWRGTSADWQRGEYPHRPAPKPQDLEVIPTLPQSVSLRADFVETVNAWARHTENLEVAEHVLCLAYQDMDPLPTDPRAMLTITVSVYCECTLLLSTLLFRWCSSSASRSPHVPRVHCSSTVSVSLRHCESLIVPRKAYCRVRSP